MKSLFASLVLSSLATQVITLSAAMADEVKKDAVYTLTSRKCSDGGAVMNEPWTEEELVGKFSLEFKSTGKFVVIIGGTEMVNSDYKVEGNKLYTIQQPSAKVVESNVEAVGMTLKMTSSIPQDQRASYCPNGGDAIVADFSIQ